MRSKTALLPLLLLLAGTLGAQSMQDIAGSWKGDKALGDVIINEDGSGTLTFVHDSELTMAVSVTLEKGQFIIEQKEPNRTSFYTGIFDPAIAGPLAQEARPMRWAFHLSRDGNTLSGTKYTSSVDYEKSPPRFVSCDNNYQRPAEWTRLSGQVKAPVISPAGGSRESAFPVTLTSPTSGAQIYYTLDGSAPDAENGTPYRAPFEVSKTATVRAVALRRGWQNSPVTTATYVFPSPQITQDDGGDGMTIQTAKRIPLNEKKRFYHINDTNYTEMFYKFDVQAPGYQIYEIRIWDKEDDDKTYDTGIVLRNIYGDLEMDSKIPIQERGDSLEIVPSQSGTLYMQLRNQYYAQSGRFEIRVRPID